MMEKMEKMAMEDQEKKGLMVVMEKMAMEFMEAKEVLEATEDVLDMEAISNLNNFTKNYYILYII